MKNFLAILMVCGVALAQSKGKPIFVKNEDAATQLVDDVLKFVASNPQFDSERLPDMANVFLPNKETDDYNGAISLRNGKITGVGNNPRRNGKVTIAPRVQQGGTPYIWAPVHFPGIKVQYQNVKLLSLLKSSIPQDKPQLQSFQGLFKDIEGIIKFDIDGQGVLSMEDLEINKYTVSNFEFAPISQQSPLHELNEVLVNRIMNHVREESFDALKRDLKDAIKAYPHQL